MGLFKDLFKKRPVNPSFDSSGELTDEQLEIYTAGVPAQRNGAIPNEPVELHNPMEAKGLSLHDASWRERPLVLPEEEKHSDANISEGQSKDELPDWVLEEANNYGSEGLEGALRQFDEQDQHKKR